MPETSPSAPLHFSQQLFWYAVSSAIFIGTGLVVFGLVTGRIGTVRVYDVEIGLKTEHNLEKMRDRLGVARQELASLYEQQDDESLKPPIEKIDQVLSDLGKTQQALAKRRQGDRSGFDFNSGFDDWEVTPAPKVPLKKKPKRPQ